MSALTARIFLVTGGLFTALWLTHEFIWLPYEYELMTADIEKGMASKLDAIRGRFDDLDESERARAVAEFNRVSDDLITLVDPEHPTWPDLVAEIDSTPGSDFAINGDELYFLTRLEGSDTILRNEILFIDPNPPYAVYVFILTAFFSSLALLGWALRPWRRKINSLTQAALEVTGDVDDASGSGSLSELTAALKKMNKHLDSTVEDLHESIVTQRDLLHAVAHEFRGPIARLRFAHDMLADNAGVDDKSLFSDVDRAIEDLDALVSEVLGYSRIKDGGYRLKLDDVPIREFIEDVLDKARGEFPAVTFSGGATTDASVRTDRIMLDRALSNVLRNGGRFAHGKVRVAASIADNQLEVVVDDDGSGIAPGKRERIFEPFTRLDASRSRETGGSGLGLAIVHAICTRLDGDVSCEDSDLGGARFRIRIAGAEPA